MDRQNNNTPSKSNNNSNKRTVNNNNNLNSTFTSNSTSNNFQNMSTSLQTNPSITCINPSRLHTSNDPSLLNSASDVRSLSLFSPSVLTPSNLDDFLSQDASYLANTSCPELDDDIMMVDDYILNDDYENTGFNNSNVMPKYVQPSKLNPRPPFVSTESAKFLPFSTYQSEEQLKPFMSPSFDFLSNQYNFDEYTDMNDSIYMEKGNTKMPFHEPFSEEPEAMDEDDDDEDYAHVYDPCEDDDDFEIDNHIYDPFGANYNASCDYSNLEGLNSQSPAAFGLISNVVDNNNKDQQANEIRSDIESGSSAQPSLSAQQQQQQQQEQQQLPPSSSSSSALSSTPSWKRHNRSVSQPTNIVKNNTTTIDNHSLQPQRSASVCSSDAPKFNADLMPFKISDDVLGSEESESEDDIMLNGINTAQTSPLMTDSVIPRRLDSNSSSLTPPPVQQQQDIESNNNAKSKSATESKESSAETKHSASMASRTKRRNNHIQAGPHRCELKIPGTGKPCLKVFSRSYDLIRHQDTIHAPVRKTFSCPKCGPDSKTFSRMDALSRHIRVKHMTSVEEASAAAHAAIPITVARTADSKKGGKGKSAATH